MSDKLKSIPTLNPLAQRLRIKVYKKNIDEAIEKDSRHCMIADAIQERFPSATHINVLMNKTKFTLDGIRYCFDTPRKAANRLLDFDAGRRDLIKPFEIYFKNAAVALAGLHQANIKRKPQVKPHKRHEYPKKVVREFGLNKWTKALSAADANRNGILL